MKPIVLTILDGVGIRKEESGNALLLAKTPNFDYLWKTYPHTLLEASGKLVGLPEGQMGNSEVGHMNLGAGRIVYQPLSYINEKIDNKEFFKNNNILEVINHIKNNNSTLHLMGLISDGGVHSHINHLMTLIDMAIMNNVPNFYLHLFLDGRDVSPGSSPFFLKQVEDKLKQVNCGKIATVSGRYYSMDRDNRWERTNLFYDAIVNGKGEHYNCFEDMIEFNLNNNLTDEFMKPAIFDSNGVIKDNDGIIIFNFRPDRLGQLLSVLANNNFNDFERVLINNLKIVTMMPVNNNFKIKSAFQLEKLVNTLGEYLSEKGYKQLRIAETEKYAHVTYFFDGGILKELDGCQKILIPSPKVKTYDLKPEMSACEITDRLLENLNYDVIILNYANGDMVGHTGNLEATIKALETVDDCLGKLYNKVKEIGGTLVITADHGNAEYMLDENNKIVTSHTTNKVPFIITKSSFNLKEGCLGNIAPTILDLLKVEKPKEMISSLLKRN